MRIKKKLGLQDYVEVSVSGRVSSSVVERQISPFFRRHGFQASDLAHAESAGRIKVSVYLRSLKKIREMKQSFRAKHRKGLRFSSVTLRRPDWFLKWKRDFHIMPVGSGLIIVPMWERARYHRNHRQPIFLEPRGAFGAGTHESTRMMIRAIEGLKGKFKSYFDIGTGTGVLSVAAWRLGAQKILGLDLDGASVETARHNLFRNGCCKYRFVRVDIARFPRREQFDLVGANLFTTLLLKRREKIFSFVKKGKFLIVSGVLRDNLEDFREGFRSPSFRCLKIARGKKWSSLIYQRIKRR